MIAKKRQTIPTVRDQRGTLVDTLAPKNQAESWALLDAMRMFVRVSEGFGAGYCAAHGLDVAEIKNVLHAMLARSEGME